jgi:hypothetical protein
MFAEQWIELVLPDPKRSRALGGGHHSLRKEPFATEAEDAACALAGHF